MFKRIIIPLVLVICTTLFLISCKNSGKNKNLFPGKWDLIYWNNELSEGTFVFKDSTVYFNMNYQTEIGNYRVRKDTLWVNRTGGSIPYLSMYDYWIVEKIDSIFFKIVSSGGNIVTAYKKGKYKKMQNPGGDKPAGDTVVLSL